MKKSVLIVAALGALVLGGCAHREHHQRQLPPLEARIKPQVTVTDNKINAPLVLYFFPSEKNVTITWTLPADSKYRFPENGIVIEGALTEQVLRQSADGKAAVPLDTQQKEVQCDKQKGGLTFTCKNLNTKSGLYKYTIRVVDERGKELVRDPYVMNDA